MMMTTAAWSPELDRLIEVVRRLGDEHEQAVEQSGGKPSQRTLDRWRATSAAAERAFARLNGWRVAGRFTIAELQRGRRDRLGQFPMSGSGHRRSLLDHTNHFALDRRPVAIVGHPYVGPEAALESAAALEIKAVILPASWYYPDHTIGVLITPKTEAAS